MILDLKKVIMKRIMYLVLATVFISSCIKSANDKELPTVIEEPTDTSSVFELKWSDWMYYPKTRAIACSPIVYKDWFIRTGTLDDPPKLVAYDKRSGEKAWEYTHVGKVNSSILASKVLRNRYIGLHLKGLVAINLDNQETDWEIDLKSLGYSGGYYIEEYEGKIYVSITKEILNSNRLQGLIMEVIPETGEYKIIYKTDKGVLSSPMLYRDAQLKLNLIMNEYPGEKGVLPKHSAQNVIRVEVETGREVWRNDSITDFEAGNAILRTINYDNRVFITGGDHSMYGLDIETGKKLWRNEIDERFSIFVTTNHLLKDDRLYVNSVGHDIRCINPETGELIWKKQLGPNCSRNMLYYEKEDWLVYASWGFGSVMALDGFTGELIHREHRFEGRPFLYDMIYDEETDQFFTHTTKHALSFKLNKLKK